MFYGIMTAILLFSDMLIRKLDWWELRDGYNKCTVRYQKQRLHFHWKILLTMINTHFQLYADSWVNKSMIDNEKNSNLSNSDNNDDFTGLKQDILDKKSFTCNIIWTDMSA